VIAEIFGWRWVFIGLVIPGLIIAVLVFFLKEPNRGLADGIDLARDVRGITFASKRKGSGKGKHGKTVVADTLAADAQAGVAPEPQAPQNTPEPEKTEVNLLTGQVWKDMLGLFKERTLRLVLISQGLLFLGLGGLFVWVPTFFERGFDLGSGAASGIAGGMGLIGILVGFAVSLRLGDRFVGRRKGWRLQLGAIGASIGCTGLLVIAISPVLPLSILAWVTLNVGFFLSVPAYTAALADLSGAKQRGLVFALSTLVIQATTSVAPAIIGGVSDLVVNQGWASSSTSLRFSFVTLAIPVVAGVLVALRARAHFDEDSTEARRRDALTT
jgi:MFS family permease